jgi:sulfhydrogenase subunit alpha
MYKKYFNEHWKKNPLYHNAAQALEIMYCFERIPQLADILLGYKENPPVISYTTKDGAGTGLVEAPRGLLIHHHEIEDGLVKYVDIITPTAMNCEDIERYCHIAAQELLDKGKEEEIKARMDLIVRAFDPCISCSAHAAQVEQAQQEAWKDRLTEITTQTAPVFIGVGNDERSDDRIGLKLASVLKESGMANVFLESDIQADTALQERAQDRPIIFIDAVNFGERAGKITMFPVEYILNNAALSHKFIPFLSGQIHNEQIKNSFVLGIQPQSTDFGQNISPQVLDAMDKIIDHLKN